uniref:Zonadhesin n=1 Tax=Seriola lalandi dorsalis TaxID=1841481 RepID=A0A3B4XQK3_SERLL
MLGGVHTDLLVTVTLLFLSQTVTQCRVENDFSLAPLTEWRTNAEYVTQCFYDRQNNLICDWTRSQQRTEDRAVSILESGPLGLEGEACLEFWYQAPVAANGSELRAILKSSDGRVEIWASPALPGNTWRQVFVPLNSIKPRTQVVLEAVSVEGKITFNQIGVRRGSCGPQCESNTEIWTDESTRCLCSAGQLSCSPSQCPKGQICGPQRGGSSGISTSGTCTIHSHTDCSTFDGVLFRFMAPCTYILAKTCSPAEALPMFRVEVVNEQNRNSSLPTVQQVTVNTGNFRVSLLKQKTHRVVVNGVWRKLPLSLGDGTVNIKSNPAAVVLGTSFGLSVSYDSAGAVHVALPPTYSDKVCGLCGNFNHLGEDDFRKPDGTNAHNATALAESWQTGQITSSCETILVPHQCDPLEEAEYASELYCGGLLSSTGPFADCQSVLEAESYFRGCVVSMCSAHGDPEVLCEALQVYTDICKEAGVDVPIWRNSTFCPPQCGENSYYNSCADGCPEVCSSLDLAGSCGSCEERCECESGFKLSGGKCVPAEDCGCWHNGKHYEKGATFLEGECVQQCQCMGNNDLWCTAMQCADNEVCKVKDGVKDCFPFKPATCRVYGDPHYMTFDKVAYDFQGGCSYTLATTCGEGGSVQFTVTGHNMHPPLQNLTRSKLEAVTLQIEDYDLTLNQSGEVYVNNGLVHLPYSTNGTYGSVWVHKESNYIILESTFGVRIMVDGQNRLFLQVDERYKHELCGMCGIYSGHQDDDLVTPDGQNATDAFQFGESWRVPNNNECTAYPNDPRRCDYDEEDEAYSQCNALLRDPFKSCHGPINPGVYLRSCVYDYCATNGDQYTLCESLKSYAAACQVEGVELPPWQTGTACADPPTTSTPPTTPTPTDQTFCPMNCDFEKNLCGWEQLIQDSFDWTRNSGSTPSDLTGPNQDHTTGAGFYIYIEGDRVTHGDSARLMSSVCHYHSPLCLQFWYHMHGSATAMALNIYLLKGNKATKLWSMMNNQGPQWHLGNVDISVSGPFQIIVEGIRGSNAQSDVAIDDVSIHFGTCSGGFPGVVSGTELPSITAEVLPPHPACNLDCSFNRDLCSWNQMITDAFDWTWQSGSTPTLMTGPSADHTGDGHYLYTEANSASHGDTARLISSECSDSGPQCLQFWYHMYGSADTMGLHVYLVQNRVTDALWWKRNDQGNMWHLAQVEITTTRAFQIIFEGRRGSNDQSDVAIDDIKLYRGHCSDLSGVVTAQPPKPDLNTTAPPSVFVPTTVAPEPPPLNDTANITTPPTVESTSNLINKDNVTEAPDNRPPAGSACQLHCNFEQDLCHWSQLLADVFDWTRHSGSTPTMMTGPSSDHTTGDGHYLYIEGNSASHGDTARLITSECSDAGPQCLQFWYHMYGSADTMGLNVYLLQDRKADAVWRKRNDQGNMWHLAQVDLTTTGAFQIIFEGRRGSNDQSDVAIDDISIHHRHCADLAKPTTPAPKTVDSVATAGSELPPANSSSTTKPPSTSSSKPQPALTTTFTTMTATITAAPTDCDTQTPTNPSTITEPPHTSNHDVPMTTRPDVPATATPQPPTTSRPIATTTIGPQTTVRPQPPTTARPQPPTETQPQTSARPQPSTTALPESQTTNRPQPPPETQPPITNRPQPPTTARPQPSTTARPQPSTTARPQPSTTARPQPPTETQPPTTMQPQPPTTALPESQTTNRPQPPTTAGPQPPTQTQPPTTMQPQPPTTALPESQTTNRPQPPTSARPQPSTTAQPESQTTNRPQPPTGQPESQTTNRPQPPTETQPQPQTSARPQPSTTAQAESQTTKRPQPPTTAGPQPPTTARPQPPTTARPQPPTTARPQPPTTARPQPPTTARPQPPTTAGPQPPTTAGPQPPTETQPPTTMQPQPPTTALPESQTTNRPQPPTTAQTESQTNRPQPPTTVRPQPPPTGQPESQTTNRPQPPTTAGAQPPTTAEPQPPTETQPPTTMQPQPPMTALPASQTTNRPQPPTTAQNESQTNRPQPPTTAGPQPPTTALPESQTTNRPQPPTTARPQPPTTAQPESQTTNRPQPPTETRPQPQTTARPKPSTTAQPESQTARPQPPTTAQPESQTTIRPQVPTTTTPQPQTSRPQPSTTIKPQPTIAISQSTATLRPEPTTAGPQPTTIKPHPPTDRPQSTSTSQPPTTPVPTPSCPENSHYTSCIPACSPTCTQLNGPPHCSDSDSCVSGCVCDNGFVQKSQRCVPIQECGCVDRNGTKHQFNEVWYTNHCSQKCECEKDDGMGEIDCDDKDECDGNAVCLQSDEGEYYCQSTGFNECTIKGDPEYRTFDKMKHDFDGEHSYVLVQTKNLPNNLPDVYIEVINRRTVDDDDDSQHHGDDDEDDSDEDDDSKENEEHHRLQELKIRVYNHTVEFKKNLRLLVDGRTTSTPVSPTAGLNIREHSSHIYLKTDFGLSVKFDGHSKAEIILPRIYKRRVGGLCGNFDGQKRNDWMKPDGTMASRVQEFGESWRV